MSNLQQRLKASKITASPPDNQITFDQLTDSQKKSEFYKFWSEVKRIAGKPIKYGLYIDRGTEVEYTSTVKLSVVYDTLDLVAFSKAVSKYGKSAISIIALNSASKMRIDIYFPIN